MSQSRVKLSAKIEAALFAEIRAVADREGRSLQSLVEEALTDLMAKRRREGIATHYRSSLGTFAPLYERLAK